MATESKSLKKIPSVRTFAGDLDASRSKNTPTTTPVPLPKKDLTPTVIATPTTPKAPKQNTPAVKVTTPTTAAEIENILSASGAVVPLPPRSAITQKVSAETQAITAASTNVAVSDTIPAGVIITDTKKDRFNFSQAVVASIRDWFATFKNNRRSRNTPKYTVPDSSLRKGIIQKATSQTGRKESADFTSIHERVRQRKNVFSDGSKTTKKTKTTWSANTEPGYPLLPGVVVTPVTKVLLEPKRSFATPATPQTSQTTTLPEVLVTQTPPDIEKMSVVPQTESIDTTPNAAPIAAEAVVPAIVVTPQNEVLPDTPALTYTTASIADVPTPTVSVTEDVTENFEDENEEAPDTAPSEVVPSTQKSVFALNTNYLSLGVAGLLLAIGSIGFFAYTLIQNTADTVVENQITPLEVIAVPFTAVTVTASTDIAMLIAETRDANTIDTQLYIKNNTGTEVTPTSLLSSLNINLESNFAESISAFRFGFTANNIPFVAIQSNNTVAAKGGMLAWEGTLARDLAPFLETAVATTSFSDAIISEQDVRVLKATDGSTVFVYGITGNKIIITTDIFTYSSLQNKLLK